MHGVVQPPPPRSPEPSVAPQRSPPPRTPTARPSPGPGTVAVTPPRTSGERHRTALDLHQTRVLSVTSRSAPRGQGSTSRLLRPTGAHCKSHGFSFPISQVRGPLESIFAVGRRRAQAHCSRTGVSHRTRCCFLAEQHWPFGRKPTGGRPAWAGLWAPPSPRVPTHACRPRAAGRGGLPQSPGARWSSSSQGSSGSGSRSLDDHVNFRINL